MVKLNKSWLSVNGDGALKGCGDKKPLYLACKTGAAGRLTLLTLRRIEAAHFGATETFPW